MSHSTSGNIRQYTIESAGKDDTACAEDLDDSLAKYERDLIIAALKSAGNNRTRTPKLLNISRSGLYKKLKRHGISTDGNVRLSAEARQPDEP